MKLRTKLLLVIFLVSTILFGMIIGYISQTIKQNAIENIGKQIETSAESYARSISSEINYHIGISETYINSIAHLYNTSLDVRIEIDEKIGTPILKQNPFIIAAWSSWQLNTIDSLWNFDYGRKTIGVYRDEMDFKLQNVRERETDGQNVSPYLTYVKESHHSTITDPYWGVYEDESVDSSEMISILTPILYNGNFKGMGGIDIDIHSLLEIIDSKMLFYNEAYTFLTSYRGLVVAAEKDKLKSLLIDSVFSKYKNKADILPTLQAGKAMSFQTYDLEGKEVIVYLQPVLFRGIKKNWSVGIVVPMDIVLADAKSQYYNTILLGIVGLILYFILAIVFSGSITKPLIEIREILEQITKGQINNIKQIKTNSKDEIGQIIKTTNQLITRMQAIARFSHEIEKGNLNTKYELAGEDDVLGSSIVEMQNSLINATQENEKRKEQDRRITWTTSGIAKFSELLRQNNNDVDEFSYVIISNLVEYLEANQGAIFLINDKNQRNLYIERKGAYAYSNRKYEEQTFDMGVGLVGRCILEAQTIYLTDIPNDYITITSGLGEASPICLVLVPLKYNDVIYGVIEIASFKDIENYQIAFLEKIGESIASSISVIKTNTQTAKLLDESQMQSEMLSSQEEEMRQNLEEMRATQEQLQDAVEKSKEKEAELIELTQKQRKSIDAYERILDSIAYPIYYKDTTGKYLSCNKAYADAIGFEKNEIIGRTDYQFFSYEDAQRFEEIDKNILKDKEDKTHKILLATKAGKVFNGLQNKKVFYDKSNRLSGIISVLLPVNIIDNFKN